MRKFVSLRFSLPLLAILIVAAGLFALSGGARTVQADEGSKGLGQLTGMLPREKLTIKSAIQVDLDKETVRLPLYKGKAGNQTVWFMLLDASDEGLADTLGVNYAPKLGNLAINCPECVQTVKLESPTPAQNPFGQAVVNFAGAPDFSPTRTCVPGPGGFPLAKDPTPGAVAGPGYSPFIRIEGSPVVYSAPIVATGDGPFDVNAHTNTHDRALGINIAPAAASGQYLESWVDILFVKGFDAGQPIIYLSTDAGQTASAVLERSIYVPALDHAAYNGGDDFLGSARERLFGFVNGRTGDSPDAQGFAHLILDGHGCEDASASNTALINALRNGGDLLNVFGDFPTLADPRHAHAYSPLWDAQLGQWSDKAIKEGLDKRQIDENVVFNLAAKRPDVLTGPGGAPYGSAGVDINCAVVGYIDKAPSANLEEPIPNSQFPPR